MAPKAAEQPRPGQGIDRRRFLQVGTAAGLALTLAPPARADYLLAGETDLEVLSVGFLEGSDRWEDLGRMPWDPVPHPGQPWLPQDRAAERMDRLRVVPAAARLAPDRSLAGAWVDVKIHGLYPGLPPLADPGFGSVSLVHWHDLAPERWADDPCEVVVWGARRVPGPSLGSPVRYFHQLAVEPGGLELTLETFGSEARSGAPPPTDDRGERRRGHARFTVNGESDRPKLRRGVYFLGLEPGAWNRPAGLLRLDDPQAVALCSVVMSVEPWVEE